MCVDGFRDAPDLIVSRFVVYDSYVAFALILTRNPQQCTHSQKKKLVDHTYESMYRLVVLFRTGLHEWDLYFQEIRRGLSFNRSVSSLGRRARDCRRIP